MNNTIKINNIDNVAVALKDLKCGDIVNGISLLDDIPCGHKFALIDIKKGVNIIKYGYPIGSATCDIKKGQHVHVGNVKTNLQDEIAYKFNGNFDDEIEKKCDVKIKVFKRKFDRFGIRNNLMIVPLVGCINREANEIKERLLTKINKEKIDDIIVATHPYGCSQLGDDLKNTIEILGSLVNHPNNGGVLVLSLGCENNQLESFKKALGNYDTDRVSFLKAQDVEDEVSEGTKLCFNLYKKMLLDKRVEAPLSVITIGLKCGGSDGFSGISANPLVGMMSDYFVKEGASTVLSEVPEMFGAEQVLMKRSSNEEVFNKIVWLINGFKEYYNSHHQVCYENPSPGNKAGGITTLEDKSLGCVQKAGHSKVVDVLYVGDEIKNKGLNLLNGPGNDMVACTNIGSIGAQLILFTTGRGTPFGTFVPTIKISTNTLLSKKKANWIDFNAGQVIDGKSFQIVFKDFLEFVLKVINGEIKTKNEINGFEEISIFKDGVTL